jgi:hypothetical protein
MSFVFLLISQVKICNAARARLLRKTGKLSPIGLSGRNGCFGRGMNTNVVVHTVCVDNFNGAMEASSQAYPGNQADFSVSRAMRKISRVL